MGSVSNTFVENYTTSYQATWTVTVEGQDIIASADGEFPIPTLKAKYVYSGKNYGYVNMNLNLCAGDNAVSSTNFSGYARYKKKFTGTWQQITEEAMASGTTYTISCFTDYSAAPFRLSNLFKSGNKDKRTVYISGYVDVSYEDFKIGSSKNGTSMANAWYEDTYVYWNNFGSITLDAPPIVSIGTPTYATPQYAGLGAYNVPVTSATAQYGGDISTITLTIGGDSITQSYATPSVANQTLSLVPSIAGTYTPTITVTDSRGQTTIEPLPQITVNAYNIPSVSFDVYRTNDIGIKNDEGHYALIQSTISYTDGAATLTEPSIQIDGVDLSSLTDASVTWYKTWSNTNGVSNVISDWATLVPQNHMVTIYGLIDWDYDTTGKFAEDTSYQITLVANDSVNGHSTPITQTMSTAFYTIDFQAGGKEIAFGAPANDTLTQTQEDVGLFKCGMESHFLSQIQADDDVSVSGDVNVDGEIVASGSITSEGHDSPIGTWIYKNATVSSISAGIDSYKSGPSITLGAGSYIIYCYGSMGTTGTGSQMRSLRLYQVSPNAGALWSWRQAFYNGNWATISATIPMAFTEETTLRVDVSSSVAANSASVWISVIRIS